MKPFSLVIGVVVLFARLLMGQGPSLTPSDQMGVMAYQSYHGGDIDLINLSTGRLTVRAPFLSYPQRGSDLKVDFELLYHGNAWVAVKTNCDAKGLNCTLVWQQAYPNGSPNSQVGVNVYESGVVGVGASDYQTSPLNPYGFFEIWTIGMPDGTSHVMGGATSNGACKIGNNTISNGYGTFESIDGTGWQMTAPSSSCTGGFQGVTITSPSGVRSYGGSNREDRNGNQITDRDQGIVLGGQRHRHHLQFC